MHHDARRARESWLLNSSFVIHLLQFGVTAVAAMRRECTPPNTPCDSYRNEYRKLVYRLARRRCIRGRSRCCVVAALERRRSDLVAVAFEFRRGIRDNSLDDRAAGI